MLLGLTAAGCAPQTSDSERAALASLAEGLPAQQAELQRLNEELQSLAGQQSQILEAQGDLRTDVAAVTVAVTERPVCPVVSAPQAPAAPASATRRVVVQGDKMVVGELEKVWLDPPGCIVSARVDTGASSNSIHAGDLTRFERDGEQWVRFKVYGDKIEEPFEVERKVERYVRVLQQADRKGSRRPVVRMQVTLGEIQGTFDFTLADRSHLENQVLLGRNFLKDVIVVDIGRRFVQTPYDPAKADVKE